MCVCACVRPCACVRVRHKREYVFGVMQTIVCLLVSALDNLRLYLGFFESSKEICMNVTNHYTLHFVYSFNLPLSFFLSLYLFIYKESYYF